MNTTTNSKPKGKTLNCGWHYVPDDAPESLKKIFKAEGLLYDAFGDMVDEQCSQADITRIIDLYGQVLDFGHAQEVKLGIR